MRERHRKKIRDHLLALDERSRYFRFGFAAADAQIDRYVGSIDFDRDEVFGIFDRRLRLLAVAHLAHRAEPPHGGLPAGSEFGVSVLAKARKRGYGTRLFEHAMLHARNRGMRAIFIHALSENAPMLKIARAAGVTIERSGGEADGWLRLAPDSFASHLDQAFAEGAAEIDYRLKARALRPSADGDSESKEPRAPLVG